MWREHKIWHHYLDNIIASDSRAAEFLVSYLSCLRISRDYVFAIEIVDLQKYRIISQAPKVHIALRERAHVPFVFIAGKN